MISAAALVLSAHGAAAQTLPGGASEIQETHGGWRVTCASPKGIKVCAFTQQQTDKDSRQLVIGIELKPTSATKAEGTISDTERHRHHR
jgi:invasion protein IalB